MITIDATGATSGIDFEAFIRGGFLSGTTSTGYPTFNNDASATSGEELYFSYGSSSTSKYVTGHGEISYDMNTHVVSGLLNTIEFGTRGSGSFDSNGYFVGGDVTLSITGLDLTDPGFSAFMQAYLAGSSASASLLDTFADALDSGPQYFKGSAFDDVYTGTSFDDLIEGNGGNDLLAGGGGNDDIDGGAGEDTAIFDDAESSYTVTRYDNGLITVSKDGETTTLRNVEKLQFDGASVDTGDIEETPVARATIDASAMNGVDFTTYLADYFAAAELSGKYDFQGGEPDFAYGNWYYVSGSEVTIKYRDNGDTTGDYTKVVLLQGTEIAYDFIHYGSSYGHGISGDIDAITFASITAGEPASGADLFTGYSAELVISGLGIHGEPGALAYGASTDPIALAFWGITNGDASKVEALLSTYALDFIGSGGDDVFVGGIFDDSIVGDAGIDQLSGGRGNDVIDGGSGADILGGGFGDDTLAGGTGHDRLNGDEGADLLNGGRGRDTLDGGAGNDELKGGKGKDELHGGDDDDVLFGNGSNDKLHGEAGIDVLVGGRGKDQLFGGEDADTFVFLSRKDSGSNKSSWDVIRDFSQDDGDQIDLSAVKKGLVFVGKDSFSGDDPEVRYSYKKNATLVKVDVDGDHGTDFKIKLDGKIALAEADFVL